MTKQIFFFLLAVLCVGMYSCSNNDDEPSTSLAENATNQIKWVANNESNKFASIEFSKSGNYIVIENMPEQSASQQKIHFGTYSSTGLTTINLADMGVIKVKELTDNSVNMEITLNGTSTPLTFTGTKTENMNATAKTDLLCQTWEIIKYNGENVAGTSDESATFLFSKAGTYFVHFPNGDVNNDDKVDGLALWKWKEGTDESQFLYSWSGTFEGDYDGSFVTISTLTSTSLIITETYNEDDGGMTDVWELKPATNVTRSVTATSISKSIKGFLGSK